MAGGLEAIWKSQVLKAEDVPSLNEVSGQDFQPQWAIYVNSFHVYGPNEDALKSKIWNNIQAIRQNLHIHTVFVVT